MNDIAKTIFYQIKSLDPYAFLAWGAKDLITLLDKNDIENGLRFKTSGLCENIGYVNVTLNPRDYYDVTFGTIQKSKWKELNRQNDVFAFDLIATIDEMVG